MRMRSYGQAGAIIVVPLLLASTRYLLFDLNFHYPLHLLMFQLLAAATVNFASEGLSGDARQSNDSTETTLGDIIRGFSAALTLIFAVQAVLHLPNTVLFVSVPLIAHCGLLLFTMWYEQRQRSWQNGLHLGILGLVCVVFLYDDYRLTIRGMIFLGLAITCCIVTRALSPEEQPNTSITKTFSLQSILTTIVAVAVSGESSHAAINAIRLDVALALGFNILISVPVIAFTSTWLLDLRSSSPDYDKQMDLDPLPTNTEIIAILWLIGETGILVVKYCYLTPLQAIALALGVLLLYSGGALLPRRTREITILKANKEEAAYSPDESDWQHTKQQRLTRLSAILSAFGCVVISLFVVINFTVYPQDSQSGFRPRLDMEYVPDRQVDVVISMYAEPLRDIKSLVKSLKAIPSLSHSTVHIYTKEDSVDLALIRNATGASEVSRLPNVGREGHTYLHHIVDNWDSLAAHTIFIQGHVHNLREFFPRVRHYFDPHRTGFLSLGPLGNTCDCETCGDRFGWSDPLSVQEYHQQIYSNSTCGRVLLTYKGQFVASAKRIRGIDKSIWMQLKLAMEEQSNRVHQPDYLDGRDDSLDQPQFGYSLERMWGMLMQCNSMQVARKCPTLLSRTRSGGNVGDCQCFDEQDDDFAMSRNATLEIL